MNAEKYTYQVFWSADDQEYVATVLEFPSLSWLAESRHAAEDGLVAVVDEVIHDMEAHGEDVPMPLGERKFSGKFQVRTSHSVHRHLAMEAARNGVSLNALVNEKLSST